MSKKAAGQNDVCLKHHQVEIKYVWKKNQQMDTLLKHQQVMSE